MNIEDLQNGFEIKPLEPPKARQKWLLTLSDGRRFVAKRNFRKVFYKWKWESIG